MKAQHIPNLISILRILLVGPTVYFLVRGYNSLALLLFFIAGASDMLDGLLARHYGWQTRLGALLDPLGDKLLLVSCFLALGWLGHVPASLVVLVIARDLIIVFGAVGYHMLIEEISIEPLMISKINTALQLVLVIVIIFAFSPLPFSELVSDAMLKLLIGVVYISTILSGSLYIWQWGHRAIAYYHQKDKA